MINKKDGKIRIYDRDNNCLASLDVTRGIAVTELVLPSERGLSVLFSVCDTAGVSDATMEDWQKQEMPQRKRGKHMDRTHIAAGEMLFCAMEYLGYGREQVKKNYVGEAGSRPCFSNLPVDFSISHSHSLVVLALLKREDDPTDQGSKARIGVDIETKISKRKTDPIRMAERFFTLHEQKIIAASAVSQMEFMRIWTLKEAWMKREQIPLSEAFQVDVLDKSVHKSICYIAGEDMTGVILA
ncbi:MAG: 4'-phosphopantetheinyl transferase superfamily protein [Lachnospiraceae bacterium]|nr:4'-phosphopantetheinyl transferase superfamily protein [Lachnospiraceae bacterium]